MKVTIKGEEPKELEYPKLMISKLNNTIILFSKKREGTVIKSGSDGLDITGVYGVDWYSENFKNYTGEITLSND